MESARDTLERGRPPVVYPFHGNLYVNMTSRCHNRCPMCWKFTPGQFRGRRLVYETASEEPSVGEAVRAIEAWEGPYDGIVFCGLGEPLVRAEAVLEVAARVRGLGHRIRINTDGLAYLYSGRTVLMRMRGRVDELSVSLNAHDRDVYNRLCRPEDPERAYPSILVFLRDAPAYVDEVTATVIDHPWVDLAACRRIAQSLGVRFRVRELDRHGRGSVPEAASG